MRPPLRIRFCYRSFRYLAILDENNTVVAVMPMAEVEMARKIVHKFRLPWWKLWWRDQKQKDYDRWVATRNVRRA